MSYEVNDVYTNYHLAHHGIRGQKWGKQNGPPYPLDESVSTGRTLRSSLKKKSSSETKSKSARPTVTGRITTGKKKEALLDIEHTPETKKAVIRSVNPRLIKKYNKQLTTQELTEAVNRINLNASLDKSSSAFNKAMGVVNNIMTVYNVINQAATTTANLAKNIQTMSEISKQMGPPPQA
jgi:hypothetical protein